MLVNLSRPSTSLRSRLTVRIAAAGIAATLAGGLFAVSAAHTDTAHQASDDVKILADVGWNSPTPKATP
ncbi:hypothetical protein [Streptomyces sp. NPDC048349]|uniref:hypothetical protein n=1 Tax=Streptomyces sp. NPDC048349 TaxID=3155486 RepID=UPI003421E286